MQLSGKYHLDRIHLQHLLPALLVEVEQEEENVPLYAAPGQFLVAEQLNTRPCVFVCLSVLHFSMIILVRTVMNQI